MYTLQLAFKKESRKDKVAMEETVNQTPYNVLQNYTAISTTTENTTNQFHYTR
jgi:hypothetical protein